MAKIGFLGLGAMGSRMAANLIAKGHEVTVYNVCIRHIINLVLWRDRLDHLTTQFDLLAIVIIHNRSIPLI